MEIMKDWLTLPKLFQIWHISREMRILKEIMSYKVLQADWSVSQTALIFFILLVVNDYQWLKYLDTVLRSKWGHKPLLEASWGFKLI